MEAILPQECHNCGAKTSGKFCVACGQVADTTVPTLGEFLGDFFVDLINLDSRIWRTLKALLFKPGQLTLAYLDGQRARYTPPMRVYLTMSVLMFLVLALPDGDVDPSIAAALGNDSDEVTAIVDDDPDPNPNANDLIAQTVKSEVGNSLNLAEKERQEGCEKALAAVEKDTPEYARVAEGCERQLEDSVSAYTKAFVDNLPLLAFLVIPTMAGVFRLLYVFTGRRYLEHLTFLTHNHAFVFFTLAVEDSLDNVARFWPTVLKPVDLTLWLVLLLLYMPYYFYRSLRRVYGQSRLLTLIKIPAIMLLYTTVGSVVVALGATVLALFV